ncbi:hypothetical protein ONS95_002888 [Cadophora gregata]|uniref:uncharacterized protein n=1 Tax=Cadophora gregata TaxID=51156 RepID=UPI0026DCC5ED|nr:uncharacterized protein ONS95_002888 [Cadophora gregata]KAK0108066.1 hypothetical protein ONS95_002888 [Cadophora gregata]
MDEIGVLPMAALPQEMNLDHESGKSATHINNIHSRSVAPAGLKWKEVTKEQWPELKPFIRRLYLDENMTRQAVTKHIAEVYNFRLTKRQFNRKISEWGFEKNTKKAERLSVLESVKRKQAFETTTIRGRMLDKSKLERWSKLDGVPLQGEMKNSDITGATSGATSKIAEESGTNGGPNISPGFVVIEKGPIIPDASMMDGDAPDSFLPVDRNSMPINIWESVNVIDSPRLTGLLGALSLYECESFSLDRSLLGEGLDVDDALAEMERCPASNSQDEENDPANSTAVVGSDVHHHKHNPLIIPTWKFQDRPTAGLSPFAAPTAKTMSRMYGFSSLDDLQLSEAKCMAKMRRWSKMAPVNILNLADSMAFIAKHYHFSRDYHSALLWYRRIIRMKRHAPVRHLNPNQILDASLNVILCLLFKGACVEARNLHRDFHKTILDRFADQYIAIGSRDTLAVLLTQFGENKEAEVICLELLQIQLSRFGVISYEGMKSIWRLADCLFRRELFSQSEKLTRTFLHLWSQLPGYSHVDTFQRITTFDKHLGLVRVLNARDQHQEAAQLLQHLNGAFPDLSAIEDRGSFSYHYELAESWRRQGRLAKSEQILQDLLHYQEVFMSPSYRASVFHTLALISEQTGRKREAASWYKKRYDLYVETFGVEHRYSMASCKYLGYCYADQALFDEAISHYERTISDIKLLHQGEEDGSQNENIETIRGWMVQVDTDKCKAIGFEFADRGLFDDAILHFQQQRTKLTEMKVDITGDPAISSAEGGITRITRWISIVQMEQCKAIGFGYADQGRFNEALSHFQQVEAELVEAKRSSSEPVAGSHTKSIERVRRWISNVVEREMASLEETGFDFVDKGQFEEAILYFRQAITRFTEVAAREPSINIYHGCAEKVQCWLSTVYALMSLDSCWETGMGYADDGLFDQAIKHFQQTMDSINPAVENGTYDPKECLEILHYWIQSVEERKARACEESASEQDSDDSGHDMEIEEEMLA